MENEELEMNVLDMLFDEENGDNVTIYDEEGNPIEFEQVALIPIEEKVYAILKPVLPMEGVGEDEGLVFEIDEAEESLNLVVEEDVIDAVFAVYEQLCDEEAEEQM